MSAISASKALGSAAALLVAVAGAFSAFLLLRTYPPPPHLPPAVAATFRVFRPAGWLPGAVFLAFAMVIAGLAALSGAMLLRRFAAILVTLWGVIVGIGDPIWFHILEESEHLPPLPSYFLVADFAKLAFALIAAVVLWRNPAAPVASVKGAV